MNLCTDSNLHWPTKAACVLVNLRHARRNITIPSVRSLPKTVPTSNQLTVVIKRGQNHQHHCNTVVPPRTDGPSCPVTSFKLYTEQRTRLLGPALPLYGHNDGRFLTLRCLSRVIKLAVPSTANAARFAPHSFRIGAATTAAATGCTAEEIRLPGRWRSNAFFVQRQRQQKIPPHFESKL